jgi:hypothetical protein
MNVQSPIDYGQDPQFDISRLESIFASKSVVFLALNILTLGIYGAAETVTKQWRVKELKITQENLKSQLSTLEKKLDALELGLTEELKKLEGDIDLSKVQTLKVRLNQFVRDEFIDKKFEVNSESAASLTKVALRSIAFVGQLFANVFTLGLYGVYQNYTLKNHITILEFENKSVQAEFEKKKVAKQNQIRTTVAMANKSIDSQIKLDTIQKTDAGQALEAMQKEKQNAEDANQVVLKLQKECINLQNQFLALQVESASIIQAKKLAESGLQTTQEELANLKVWYQHLETSAENSEKEKEKQQKELADIKRELITFNFRAGEINKLQQEIDKLKYTIAQHHDAAQIQLAELGPLPSKYTPRKEDGETNGFFDFDVQVSVRGFDNNQCFMMTKDPKWVAYAIANGKCEAKMEYNQEIQGVEDFESSLEKIREMARKLEGEKFKIKNKEFDLEWVVKALEYQNRYKEQRSAGAIVQASFEFAFSELLKMARQENAKIKITDSDETPDTLGEEAVYHYMILNLIEGGKIAKPSPCAKFALAVNEHVWMYPSNPAKVLEYAKNSAGIFEHQVVTRYERRDDFTSVELLTPAGVDCLSAKWILIQLSPEEKEHLFNLLMSSVIDNDHDDLKKTTAYMKNSSDPSVILVWTAYDLIHAMADTMSKKYGGNELAALWKKNAKGEGNPFIKEVNPVLDLQKILNPHSVQKSDTVCKWVLDPDVLQDKRVSGQQPKPSQLKFANLIQEAYFQYQKAFNCLYNKNFDLLQDPIKDKTELASLNWDIVNPKNYISHTIIGSDQFGNGGQGCLFSALLSIIVYKKEDLTVDNVFAFRNAMAAYLDKLQTHKLAYTKLESNLSENQKMLKDSPENYAKLKEMNDLAIHFENEIKSEHNCTVEAYQKWLRTGQKQANAQLDSGNLGLLEIELAAYTLQIKIGVVFVNFKMKNQLLNVPAAVDKIGRIIPKSDDCYGPNTNEVLVIASNGESYYGLFPQLKIEGNEKLDAALLRQNREDKFLQDNTEAALSPDEYQALLDLAIYWGGINMIGHH